ncbi:MAG: hypothetical protein ABS81_28515 [Pseudonocardia sp. SCN 72-86]|nr:MAG: hypothetical protein ABS81_28515 [Pseudonocardia sp. SCN 72-86]
MGADRVGELTVGSLLQRAAMLAPDTVALVEGVPDRDARRRWTYAELLADAERAGLTLVTVDPALRRDEVGHVLGRSDAAGVFLVREGAPPTRRRWWRGGGNVVPRTRSHGCGGSSTPSRRPRDGSAST